MSRDQNLREVLKRATGTLHSALDTSLSPLASGRDYPRFLAIQHSARAPIEAWFDANSAELSPPPQTRLIAADLAELGAPVPPLSFGFAPKNADEALGIAWVLAGSSLGNKLLLKRRSEHDGGVGTRFLSDRSMAQFWSGLLVTLEQPCDDATRRHAVTGATRVFEHFLAVASTSLRRLAA